MIRWQKVVWETAKGYMASDGDGRHGGLTVEQIADRVGCSVGSVRKDLGYIMCSCPYQLLDFHERDRSLKGSKNRYTPSKRFLGSLCFAKLDLPGGSNPVRVVLREIRRSSRVAQTRKEG